ncbi:MAG: ABC transporter permease subunit [Halolamina sp.]
MKRYLLARLGWTLLAAYLLLSAAFLAVALTPDPNRRMAEMAAAGEALSNESIVDKQAYVEQAGAAYAEARNRDRPLVLRYWDWMAGYATLDWGWSFAYETPVEQAVVRGLRVTTLYLLPAVVLSWVVSLVGGIYAGLRGGISDRIGRLVTYLGIGLPAVVVAQALVTYDREGVLSYPAFDPSLALLAPQNLAALAVPSALVAFSLLAVQWRAVRTESLDLAGQEFVTALRAEGASVVRLGRHLAKNATAPLASLFTGELLVVLLLTVYVVEEILGVPGIGAVTLRAFEERDVGLVLATVMLPAFVGLFGNLLADLVAGAVDPRVSEEE